VCVRVCRLYRVYKFDTPFAGINRVERAYASTLHPSLLSLSLTPPSALSLCPYDSMTALHILVSAPALFGGCLLLRWINSLYVTRARKLKLVADVTSAQSALKAGLDGYLELDTPNHLDAWLKLRKVVLTPDPKHRVCGVLCALVVGCGSAPALTLFLCCPALCLVLSCAAVFWYGGVQQVLRFLVPMVLANISLLLTMIIRVVVLRTTFDEFNVLGFFDMVWRARLAWIWFAARRGRAQQVATAQLNPTHLVVPRVCVLGCRWCWTCIWCLSFCMWSSAISCSTITCAFWSEKN
jgi:hypothetical protein